ncbi:hypothetical protein WKH57_01540 [Niallia taxi]|uniref:hypothetical protein n=1 Tax=Niallia taxi TaxID=2499688 RepID=UPI003170E799
MRKLTIQLQDAEGNVKDEKEVMVDQRDLLIMKYPKEMTVQQASMAYKNLHTAIEREATVVGVPESINFEVIKLG